jgi:hypothetical protein
MKIFNIFIVLLTIIGLISPRKNKFLSHHKLKTKTVINNPLPLITGKVVGGFFKLFTKIRVYNDDGHTIWEASKKSIVTLTGETRNLTTLKGPIPCHRLRLENIEANKLTDHKIKNTKKHGPRSQKGLWIATEHLENITTTITVLPYQYVVPDGALKIASTKGSKGNSMQFALTGNTDEPQDTDEDRITMENLYKGDIIINTGKKSFEGLKPGWDLDFTHVSKEPKDELNRLAPLLKKKKPIEEIIKFHILDGKLSYKETRKDVIAFTKTMMRIAAENAGYKIVTDDTYQLHLKANSFYGWDHWAISVKVTLQNPNKKTYGGRSYIQKDPNNFVEYNNNHMWYRLYAEELTLNIDNFRQEHWDLMDS